jgi:hypothetical protein
VLDENVMHWVPIFHLILTNDTHRLEAILKLINTVGEATTETVKSLFVPFGFFMALESVILELLHLFTIVGIWGACLVVAMDGQNIHHPQFLIYGMLVALPSNLFL